MSKDSSVSKPMSAGAKFRQALTNNKPLQVVGTINAYCAMMAEKLGHQAIYLSGWWCCQCFIWST